MDADTARRAGEILAKIDGLSAMLADLDLAIEEKWPVTSMRATAPDVDSSKPAGTVVNLVSGIGVDETTSDLVLKTAQKKYQSELDALNAELGAL